MGKHAFLSCCVLLAFLALSAPRPSHADPGDREYSEGRELLVQGKVREASESFRKAVRENPDHAEARYQLALLHMENVLTYDLAEEEFLDIPRVASKIGRAGRDDLLFRSGVALGKLYLRSGRPNLTIQLVKNIIASAPRGVALDDAYNTLGLAFYYNRLYEEAIFELRKAIQFNPNHQNAKFNLKTVRARLEHYQAGKIYGRMGDRKEQIAQFRKAIELDPRFIEARHRLGAALLASGDAAGALRELRRADAISADYRKSYEIWYAEGMALVQLGRQEEAIRLFQKAVEARPNFAAALNEVGKIHLEQGEYDEAISCFAKAIGIDPRTEYVRNLQLSFSQKAP